MKYFEDNPEIFAALVAAIAILGGLLGSVIGAKIQANGGRDQAAAAREAARIAAEAQRVAALWAVRQLQTAEYIQGVRDVRHAIRRFYREDPAGGALLAQLNEALGAMNQKQAEIILIAPKAVVGAANRLREATFEAGDYAIKAGAMHYVQSLVNAEMNSGDPESAAIAQQAIDAVNELHAAKRQGDRAEAQYAHQHARDALRAVHGVTSGLATKALLAFAENGWVTMMDVTGMALDRTMNDFVLAARAMLKSEDDVAPTVPPQRRRWWRRAAPVTPASDAAASV
ncbi:hypothetical protein ACFV0D_30275 [Streptomyces sp. NPDC059556]|uniref:hypothetical protein n=1 Tax=Streptomyces sp. NPDC059556 TaxID=3346863 RepID=UPI0036BF352C